jgi:hypothetical protein
MVVGGDQPTALDRSFLVFRKSNHESTAGFERNSGERCRAVDGSWL